MIDKQATIIELLELVDEQQSLIAHLLKERPATNSSPEIKKAMERVVSKMDNAKRSIYLMLETGQEEPLCQS